MEHRKGQFGVPRLLVWSKATPAAALRASRRRAPRCRRTQARIHVQHRDLGGLCAVAAGRTPGPHREGRQPKPMMDGAQQSDAGVVARKAANKGARVPAEPLERRAAAERNPRRTGTVRTQSRGAVSPGAERIRQFAKEKPGERLTALLHHITPEALGEAYHALKRDAAPGVDGMTWREYGDGLEERLLDLHARVRRGAYRAKPRCGGWMIAEAGRGRTAARYCLAGGQDRPAGGGGADPEPDLRVGVSTASATGSGRGARRTTRWTRWPTRWSGARSTG